MAIKRLTREETDYMREYIQEGVERGETAQQIRQRRRELADFFECTFNQVSGAVAWKTQETRLVLEKLILPTDTQKQTDIGEDENMTPIPDTTIDVSVVPESTNISIVGTIEESIKLTVNKIDELETVTINQEIETSEESRLQTNNLRIESEAPKINDELLEPIDGAIFDYDNPEKNEWREKLMQYVCERIPLEKRAKAKVLCLGGRKNLEPKAYIQNGFSPENIFSIENSKKVKGEFLASAADLGIQTYFGDINTFNVSDRFTVVSLDYPGPVTVDKQLDVAGILLEDDAVVVMNYQKKRDPFKAKKFAVMSNDFRNMVETKSPESFDEEYRHYAENLESILQYKAKNTKVSGEEWLDSRKKLMAGILVAFGENRNDCFVLENYPLYKAIYDITIDDRYDRMMPLHKNFLRKFTEAMEDLTKVRDAEAIGSFGLLFLRWLHKTHRCRPLIRDIKYEEYLSKRDGKHNPFITVYSELHTPRSSYIKNSKIANQFATMLEAMIEDDFEGELILRQAVSSHKVLLVSFKKNILEMSYKSKVKGNNALSFTDMLEKAYEIVEKDMSSLEIELFGDKQPPKAEKLFSYKNKRLEEFFGKAEKKQILSAQRKATSKYRKN